MIVYPASEYLMWWSINGSGRPLISAEEISTDIKVESEPIPVIGSTNPIAVVSNGTDYSGKIMLQNGELELILKTYGYNNATQIQNSILTIASKDGLIKRTLIGVNIISEGTGIKAKSKQTLIDLSFSYTRQTN